MLGPGPRARAAAPAPSEGINAWHDDILYLILPDRFFNGDRQSDRGANPRDPFAYHGGDLAGVTRRLDDFQQLCVTAFKFTSISDNRDAPLVGT